jgi:hypothetical protein
MWVLSPSGTAFPYHYTRYGNRIIFKHEQRFIQVGEKFIRLNL